MGLMATADLLVASAHWLHVGLTEDLRKICEDIIAEFDIEYLMPDREEYQRIIKLKDSIEQNRGP